MFWHLGKTWFSTDIRLHQPAKTPKTATKLKLTTPKAPGTNEKKATTKATKPKSERKKSKAAVSDEEPVEEEPKEPEKELDPAEAKAKKEKEGKDRAAQRMLKHMLTLYSSFPTTQTPEGLFVPRSSAPGK